jgi:hypothetical protein
MSLGLALALVLTLLPAEPLVLTDGSVLHVVATPTVTNGLAVARLLDGTVISVPASRIDWAASGKRRDAELAQAERAAERAARAEQEGLAAAERTRRPVPRKPQSSFVTNKTIETYAELEPPQGVPPAAGEAALTSLPGPAPEVAPGDAAPVRKLDDEGNGPGYWHDRARDVHQALRRAELALESARRSRQAEEDALIHGTVVTSAETGIQIHQVARTREELGAIAYRVSELRERERDAVAALEDAKQEEADLREEARRLGADPGWLRIPVAYR